MVRGRPSIFTEELGTVICERISSGESLRKITKDKKMPCISIVMTWLLDTKKKDFKEQYKTACNVRAENMFDELLEISDTKKEEFNDTGKLRGDNHSG